MPLLYHNPKRTFLVSSAKQCLVGRRNEIVNPSEDKHSFFGFYVFPSEGATKMLGENY